MSKIVIQKYNNLNLGLKISAPIKDYKKNVTYDSVVAFALVKYFIDNFPLIPTTIKNDYQFFKKTFLIDNTGDERLIFRIELIESKEQVREYLLSNAMPEKWCFLLATDSNYKIMILSNKNIYKENRSYYVKRAEKAMNFLLKYINENPKKVEIQR